MSQVKNKFLAQMANNTVKANISGSTANPTDVSAVSTATASTFMVRDTNANVQLNNLIENAAVITTAAGTTTLTVGSSYSQIFTGSSTQTIVLPNATTMLVGQGFSLYNQSSSPLAVQFNGGAAFTDAAGINYSSMAAHTSYTITLQTNGTSAGTWAVVSSPTSGLGAPGPTVQKFLSGSGTYTTPANVAFIQVTMVGGGGGGNSGGTVTALGGNGGNTTFGTSLLVANGGTFGTGGNYNSGLGGSASLGSGPIGVALTGGSGGAGGGNFGSSGGAGGSGASSPFGGQGGGGNNEGGNLSGQAAVANTGSGGGGGYTSTSAGFSGGGGGAGGYINATIISPLATYGYTVGTAGAAGGAATNGAVGGAGGSGIIVVTEYYFNGLGAAAGAGGAYTPTVTTLISGSGTFTTPANASYITVQMVGGGGGGGGSGTTSGGGTVGGSGGNTTFGTSLLVANGGTGGTQGANNTGGTASVAVSGTVLQLIASAGASGQGGSFESPASTYESFGPNGASTPLGGGGGGGAYGASGGNASANTGAGGGGGGGSLAGSVYTGGGGAAGGYVSAIILNPASTYSYSVGAAGTAGSTGGSASGGGGGSGVIIVTTYYNNGAVGTATNVTGVVAIANGGTAGTSAASAFNNLNPMTTTGDMIYEVSAGTAARLPIGTTGQVLTVVSGAPAWSTSSSAAPYNITAISTTTTATANTDYLCNTTSAAFTVTLPTPTVNQYVSIKDSTGNFGTNNLTVARHASENIEGVAASKILSANWGFWRFVSDGTNWFVLSN